MTTTDTSSGTGTGGQTSESGGVLLARPWRLADFDTAEIGMTVYLRRDHAGAISYDAATLTGFTAPETTTVQSSWCTDTPAGPGQWFTNHPSLALTTCYGVETTRGRATGSAGDGPVWDDQGVYLPDLDGEPIEVTPDYGAAGMLLVTIPGVSPGALLDLVRQALEGLPGVQVEAHGGRRLADRRLNIYQMCNGGRGELLAVNVLEGLRGLKYAPCVTEQINPALIAPR